METVSTPDESASESLLGSYLRFLRSPDLVAHPKPLSKWQVVTRSLRLYSLHLPIMLLVGILITQVLDVEESNNLAGAFESMPALALFVTVVLVAPISEEIIFRLPLRPFLWKIALAGAFLTQALVALLPGVWFLMPLWLGLTVLAFYCFVARRQKQAFQVVYRRFGGWIFYTVAILFGAVHIANYDATVWQWLPVLVLPQITIGLWLGFVRLRYGFWWAVIAHGFHNGCFLLPVLLIKLFGSAEIQGSIGAEVLESGTLSLADKIVLQSTGFYTIAGLLICAIVSWQVILEWRRSR